MKDVLIDICNLDVQLEALENYHTISEIQHGTEEAKEQVHLIEERISSVNNIVHGLNSAIERHTNFRNSQPRRLDDPELCRIRSWLQMNIEAQLYLNLKYVLNVWIVVNYKCPQHSRSVHLCHY